MRRLSLVLTCQPHGCRRALSRARLRRLFNRRGTHAEARRHLSTKRGTAEAYQTHLPSPGLPIQAPDRSTRVTIWYTRICRSSLGITWRATTRAMLLKFFALSVCPGYVCAGMRTKNDTAHTQRFRREQKCTNQLNLLGCEHSKNCSIRDALSLDPRLAHIYKIT